MFESVLKMVCDNGLRYCRTRLDILMLYIWWMALREGILDAHTNAKVTAMVSIWASQASGLNSGIVTTEPLRSTTS